MTSDETTPTRTGLKGDDASSPDTPDQGRFVPGTVLADRYRIVGLLGKGGMGEVYRADDLKLQHPVALKFLPPGLAGDPARLVRFHNEVRVARQVSHPGVCRVHDIGEVDGEHFLSMEYVDGEDLASLLSRIGRLPADKAVEIARQICAGLAAAHERGVLHRDLKPANVMIDGRGKARLTDFGLAVVAGGPDMPGKTVGTPAYMSPEQAEGKDISVRSDIYALGLVLYELFTGQRTFKGRSIEDVLRKHRETPPTTPSTHVPDLDPAVERVILGCLEKDPTQRPASALAVSASLPGGDPLVAALAAGVTPSPEMVAGAGDAGILSPRVAWSLLLAFVVFTGASRGLRPALAHRVPWEKSPQVLADRARQILESAALPDRVGYEAVGFDYDHELTEHIAREEGAAEWWRAVAAARPAAIYFWYRRSLVPLIPRGRTGTSLLSPAPGTPGAALVVLDTLGRLLELRVVPNASAAAGTGTPDWSHLFSEAGLDAGQLTPAVSMTTPPDYADSRAAWHGTLPGWKEVAFRIEAAGLGGRPAYFRVSWPWSQTDRTRPRGGTGGARLVGVRMPAFMYAVVVVAIVGAGSFTWRNLRLGRGDRKGAARLAGFVFALSTGVWLFRADHVAGLEHEVQQLVNGTAFAFWEAAFLWCLYIALEPYVRRLWPQVLVSWSRLLSGRFRDPLVGRDLLIGSVFGSAITLCLALAAVVPGWLGGPVRALSTSLVSPLGAGRLVSTLLSSLKGALLMGLGVLFFLLLLRVILGNRRLVPGTVFLALTLGNRLIIAQNLGGSVMPDWVFAGVVAALETVLIQRFGLLATVAGFLVVELALHFPVLVWDLSHWSSSTLVTLLAAYGVIGTYGFVISRGGRPLLGDTVLGD